MKQARETFFNVAEFIPGLREEFDALRSTYGRGL